MDGRNQAQAAHNGHRQGMDISKSTLSATAAIFIPRSYHPPPPPQHQQHQQMIPQEFQHQQPEFCFQNNEGFAQQQQQQQQQQPGFDNFHAGGHRGGYVGGGYYNQNNNRGNYRGRGRGRGYRGGRGGRGNFHSNNYHGGTHGSPHVGMGHHGGMPGHNPYMVPSQDPVEQIKQVIALLTDNPGMFDDTMQPLTASLATLIRSETEIQNVIEQLFGQSVRETNFRYTGARMCNYFSQNLQVNIPNVDFRTQLLRRCVDEHNKRDQLAHSPGTVDPLIGFTLFIGELLVNLTDEQESQHVVHVLTTAIQELVNTLLSASFDTCLRCVVQVLKLTGASLDRVEASITPSGKPEAVDAIFDRIKALIQEERMQIPTSRSLKIYLQSVVDLRATEWGKKETDGRPKQINPYLNMEVPTPLPDPNVGGMLYDASVLPNFPVWSNGTPEFNSEPSENRQQAPQPGGGQEMFWSPTEEEEYLAFMMSGEQEPEFQGEEMDEEIADAFEEFMRENAQRQQHQ